MKAKFFQRVGAYLIDGIIILTIVAIIFNFFPVAENVVKLNETLLSQVQDILEGKVTINKALPVLTDITYDIEYNSMLNTIITIAISTIFLVIIPFYNEGQSIGKKLLKIKVKSISEELTMNQLMIRMFVLNRIIFDAFNMIALVFLKKSYYLSFRGTINLISGTIFIVIVLMIMFRKDGRGIHDMISKTEVVRKD